jgi:hypothetical protein
LFVISNKYCDHFDANLKRFDYWLDRTQRHRLNTNSIWPTICDNSHLLSKHFQ